jgi:hypothetical protein
MLRRFRLDRTGAYEKLVIAECLAHALAAFIEGRQAPLEMGAEQGGIPHWDDIVVLHCDGLHEHIQIKRQAADFDESGPLRAPNPKTPSEFDKAIASLADWSRGHIDVPRKFVLKVPALQIQIKKGYYVRQFEELCSVCRLAGTTAEALEGRDDGPTTKAFLWLTTWCGFEDWAHILSALKHLTISIEGVETDLRDRAVGALDRHFTSGQNALDSIIAYVGREIADVSAISCRPLLKHLLHLARPELVTWTQYHYRDAAAGWSVSGTHDVASEEIESAGSVVERLWKDCGTSRKLRIAAQCPHNDPHNPSITATILRLALHLQGSSQALISGEASWRARAQHELGHTLGIGDSDFEHMTWLDDAQPPGQSTLRQVQGIVQTEGEANDLALAMDQTVWLQIVEKMQQRLGTVQDIDLRRAMALLWEEWRNELAQEPIARSALLSRMMYPRGEGKDHVRALRVGPKATGLLTDALETLVLVAVGLNEVNANWQQFGNLGSVCVIALRRWSGPSNATAYVRDVPSDGLSALLGPEASPIVILSGVEDSPSEVLGIGLADDARTSTSMATPRQPRMLITRSSSIRQRLRNGTLEGLRTYFRQAWQSSEEAREEAIRYASGA